jgi:hypothetical protein
MRHGCGDGASCGKQRQEVFVLPAVYDRFPVAFQYPENWQLSEDQSTGWPRSVSVTAASGAFWAAAVYPSSWSAEGLCQQALDVLRQEYRDLETQPHSEPIAGQQAAGFELNFYCLDFLVRCRLLAVTAGSHMALVTCQAEDREFDTLEDVFRAITTSLVTGSSGPVT